MIYDLFIAYESFSVEKWLKCDVALIILKIKKYHWFLYIYILMLMKIISDIYMDKNMIEV
jgi:hypothetical protein